MYCIYSTKSTKYRIRTIIIEKFKLTVLPLEKLCIYKFTNIIW